MQGKNKKNNRRKINIAINNAKTNNKDIIGFVCGKYIKKVS